MLTYQIQVNNFNNETSTIIYEGSKMLHAMIQFKNEALKGSDVVLFILDENGNTLDTMTSYDEVKQDMEYLITGSDNVTLQSELNDSKRVKELYEDQLNEVKEENKKLSNQIESLKSIIAAKKENEEVKPSQPVENKLNWYSYRLRGFSPFCQPKGHIKLDPTIGRYGIIAYDRELTQYELDEYELIPYNREDMAS